MDHPLLTRRRLLGTALLLLAALSWIVLEEVGNTVVFAITVAYVLFPPRQYLVGRGYSRPLATTIVTAGAALGLTAVSIPAAYVVYRRRGAIFELLRSLPATIPVEVGGFSYVIETTAVVTALQSFLGSVALSSVSALTVLAFKAILFALVVYSLLYRPFAVKTALIGLVPRRFHDIVAAYHERTRATLVGLYVVQAVTAVGTTVLAYVVFAWLGYDTAVSLAVAAGILQFIPVLGPSIIIVALAGLSVLQGDITRALLVLIVGLSVVGFLPDAVIRPRMAGLAADLPTTLYFVGFVGGVLTLGPVGFVVGPLVVALLVETVELLAKERRDRLRADAP